MIGQYLESVFGVASSTIKKYLRRGKWVIHIDKVNQFALLDNKIRGPNGVFWGRVGLFGFYLHFYFGLLVAGKKKQYLNSKENKKEEKGA